MIQGLRAVSQSVNFSLTSSPAMFLLVLVLLLLISLWIIWLHNFYPQKPWSKRSKRSRSLWKSQRLKNDRRRLPPIRTLLTFLSSSSCSRPSPNMSLVSKLLNARRVQNKNESFTWQFWPHINVLSSYSSTWEGIVLYMSPFHRHALKHLFSLSAV